MFNEGYIMGGSYQLPLYAGDPPEVGFVDEIEIILTLLSMVIPEASSSIKIF